MTGYGISQARIDKGYIEVVIQSFNNKYLDIRYQVPSIYNSLKGEAKTLLDPIFQRGHIEISVTRNPLWPQKQTTVSWNRPQALMWKKIYQDMSKALKMRNNLDLLSLSSQPGVLQTISEPSFVPSQEKQILKKLLLKAAQMCDRERVREGQSIKKDFQKNIKELNTCLKNIKEFNRKKIQQSQSLLKKKFKKKSSKDQQKALDETAEDFMKQDIGEELSRLKEHIRAFQSLFSSSLPTGKKMSFYLQEMIREINTIGSKSQHFQLANQVVNGKSLIEKIREQVQNVE